MTKLQRREHPRQDCEQTITFAPDDTKSSYEAIMRNFSRGGLYFESKHALKKGTGINVKLKPDMPPELINPETLMTQKAEVRWCMEIANSKPVRYGCGIQYS